MFNAFPFGFFRLFAKKMPTDRVCRWAGTDIVSVFEKLHPYMIMMERKGRPVKLYINFNDLKIESGSKTTELYWFPSEDELAYHTKYSLADSVEYTQIEEGWYVVEETYPW